jgi:uncharacterized protein YacL
VKFTANFYSRLIGAILLMYAGFAVGSANSSSPPTATQVWATNLLMLCGAAIGLILAPYLTVDPLERLIRHSRLMPWPELLGNFGGLLIGLLVAALITVPLSRLPGLLGAIAPTLAALLFGYIGFRIARARKQDIQSFVRTKSSSRPPGTKGRRTLVDTSIIIDGRIGDLIKTGFVTETLLVPRFVLRELQRLADSADEMTRARGKRGLDTLRMLQESQHAEIKISDQEYPEIHEVDDKLVALARAERVALLTNDMNLEHVAQLQGVRVLNLNRLADAIRIPFSTGDRINVTVRSEGREREQGVGFSDDGTMIVVEDARALIGQEVHAIVTRVYATQTGRIIFAQLDRQNGGYRGQTHAERGHERNKAHS